MIKSITAIALATLAAFTASAAEAKPADCRARDVRIECYLDAPHQSAVSPNQNQDASDPQTVTTRTPEAGGFREPNASPEQVARANEYSQAAFRQCMAEVRRDESRRGWNEAGQQVGVIVADRLIGGNSGGYYGGSNYRYNNGGNQSLQSCEEVRNTVYSDMLRATPASYCDRVMTSTRRRDGTLVNGGNVDERCLSRSAEPFDAGMRYRGN